MSEGRVNVRDKYGENRERRMVMIDSYGKR